MIRRLFSLIKEKLFYEITADLKELRKQEETSRLLMGRIASETFSHSKFPDSLNAREFKVYSQFGDDGIIQFLVQQIKMPETFIEFGVENYRESNTRFLLQNNNWKGLIIDGSASNIQQVRREEIYWRHDLTAVEKFITRENINQIFKDNGFSGDIGILSIDIDGNDYWIWDSINNINPSVVIIEYNSVFGDQLPISVPYKPDFVRTREHHSNLFWGASLPALQWLGEKKGYKLIGCNSAGNNAYFIRNDISFSLAGLSARQAYVKSRYRESIDPNGKLTFISGDQRLKEISDCVAVNVSTGVVSKIKEHLVINNIN